MTTKEETKNGETSSSQFRAAVFTSRTPDKPYSEKELQALDDLIAAIKVAKKRGQNKPE